MRSDSAPWVIVDVETTGSDPDACRVISVAALAVTATGAITDSVVTLLDAGVDPGPTDVHGLTRAMLIGQPRFADIADALAELLRGRTLVAHNVAFDYAFLAAEARRAGTRLPVDEVMCTVELARRLNLGVGSLKLAALAHHWNIAQTRPHDALDDALVLVEIFQRELAQAQNSGVALPIRHPRTLEPPVFEMRGADLLKAS